MPLDLVVGSWLLHHMARVDDSFTLFYLGFSDDLFNDPVKSRMSSTVLHCMFRPPSLYIPDP